MMNNSIQQQNQYDVPFNTNDRYDYNSENLDTNQVYNDNIYPDEYPDSPDKNDCYGNANYYNMTDATGYEHTTDNSQSDYKTSNQDQYNNGGSRSRDNYKYNNSPDYHESKSSSSDPDYRNRERERERSNRRSRDDKRRSDRSRDRDRDRERGRDRDRSRDRDRRDRDRYERTSHSISPDDDRYGRDDRSTDRWTVEKPTSTILLRGLPSNVDEAYISKKLAAFGVPARDIRIMRRNAGSSRGFAFVEFTNIEDARQWMEINQGRITLMDQSVTLHYSTPKNAPPVNFQTTRCDWICKKCGVHNFRRRDVCFKCGLSREESDRVKTGEGFDDVGLNPCNTLIFRGLDALTTEETLLQTLNAHSLLPIKNIQIMRDKATSVSRGYGFAELNSVSEATALLQLLTVPTKPPFEVDGKQIIVAYAKNTFSTVMATQNHYSSGHTPADHSSNYYPTSGSTSRYDYNQYYNQSVPHTSVAQSAIEQAHAAQSLHKTDATGNADYLPPETEHVKYPPPDVSTYQYDETSGYYYDPLTTLYYDANTQYYYNSHTTLFMYWDAAKSTYLPAPTEAQDNVTDKDKEENKKDKVKIAKKVAKEMEKWAKTLNTKKDTKKSAVAIQQFINNGLKESATADAGFAMFAKKAEDQKLMPPPPSFGSAAAKVTSDSNEETKSLLVASYGGDSDEEEEEQESTAPDESKLLDWTKLACLLCKRQFQSKEILTKHVQFSDLHKQNVEKWKNDNKPKEVVQQPLQYRDRAKERREKFGPGIPPEPKRGRKNNSLNMFAETESLKAKPLEGGVGSKLMGKMGWSSGQGLGRSNQGQTDIVTVTKRSSTAGLGARGSTYGIDASATYQDGIKQMMQSRYEEAS